MKTFPVLACLLLLHSVCLADDIGFINIKEPKPERQQPQTTSDEIGIITVTGDIVGEKKTKPSEAAEDLSTELSRAENFAATKDYESAFETINKIRAEHPDTPIVWKWSGIYAILSGEYEQGIELLDRTRAMFPLDEATQNGIEFDFYKALALIEMKEPADELIEKIEQAKPFGFSRELQEDQKNLLVLFLKCKASTDLRLLEQAWKIERSAEALNNYHGFMLSELCYMYGMELDRKEALSGYVKLEEKNNRSEIIQKVQAAKIALRKT